MPKLGPGTLEIGEVGTEVDASCLVNGMAITSDSDKDDDKTMLCGTVKAGAITFTYTMEGNVDIDPEAGAAGLFALSQDHAGEQVPFTFTPNTADGTTATGVVTVAPLDFGADEFGADLSSDLSWSLVGKPTYTYGTGALAVDETVDNQDALVDA